MPSGNLAPLRAGAPSSSLPAISAGLAAVLAGAAGCGGGDEERPMGGPLGQCEGVVFEVKEERGLHVSPPAEIEWSTNPPSTGQHYPTWAGWYRSFTSLPRGFWMHNAEHGGVMLLYNCPDGCDADIAALIDVARARPQDDKCVLPIRNRILVVADPLLPAGTKISAVAWNAYYTATCVDPVALDTFIEEHYARGPEDFCSDGPAMGGLRIP